MAMPSPMNPQANANSANPLAALAALGNMGKKTMTRDRYCSTNKQPIYMLNSGVTIGRDAL